MIKRCCFGCDVGRNKVMDSQNSLDSIGSINCIDFIASIESEISTDSIYFIDSKHRQHSHRTQRGRAIVTMCGVNVGGVLNL